MMRWSDMNATYRNGRGTWSWKQQRKRILAESDICWICGRPGATTVDHLIPLSQGGTNDAANLAPAHAGRQPWGCPGNYGRGKVAQPSRTTRAW
jgi:5-methylcytosine-specific restriction endonuclease McrA